MTDIYEQHDKAFARVSAWVIVDPTNPGLAVATVAIKFPADGAGRLWAYAHFLGLPMQRASASGYGYDKRSPAVIGAFRKGAKTSPELDRLITALGPDDGEYWDTKLRRAGYLVLQAV